MKIGKVALDGSVEVDSTPLHKLHDGGIREELGNGPHPINGVGGGGNSLLRVGHAETLSPDHLPVIHDRDGNRRQGLIFHLLLNRLRERRCHAGIRRSGWDIDLRAQGGADQTAEQWNKKACSQRRSSGILYSCLLACENFSCSPLCVPPFP